MKSQEDDASTQQAAGGAPSKLRRLFADGELWVVREVGAPRFDRRGGTHLVFECSNVMRRLRVFPAHWNSLSDEDLYALTSRLGR